MSNTDPNAIQIDGNHYSAQNGLQHWDLIELYNHGYLEGYATKYVVRHRQKNGDRDLLKARHVLQKLISMVEGRRRLPRGIVPATVIDKWCVENQQGTMETQIMQHVLRWESTRDLRTAVDLIEQVLQRDYNYSAEMLAQ